MATEELFCRVFDSGHGPLQLLLIHFIHKVILSSNEKHNLTDPLWVSFEAERCSKSCMSVIPPSESVDGH